MKIKFTGYNGMTSCFPLPSQKEHELFMRKKRAFVQPPELHRSLNCQSSSRDRFQTFFTDNGMVRLSEYELNKRGFYEK